MSHQIVQSENMAAGRITKNPNPRPKKFYAMADGSPVRDFLDPDDLKKAIASGAVVQVDAPAKEPEPKPVQEMTPKFEGPIEKLPPYMGDTKELTEELLAKLALKCKDRGAYLVDQNGQKITNISIKYLVPQQTGVSFE